MKYTSAILALASAAAVSAQDISVFPECALPCIISAVGTTSCAATDFACVCKNMDAVKTGATPCVVDKCGVEKALNEVLPATEKFCAAVGSNPPAATTKDTPAPTTAVTTAAPAPTSTSASEPAPSPTGGDDSDDDGEGEEEPEETGAPSVPPSSFAPSPTSTSTTKPTSSAIHTAGAVAVKAVSGFGMLVLGAVAAL
ncbi:hypothetical protein C8A05DRAFT_36688 [Staphylotrichum tortipilum]|uniref:CFEM domain-containing protein n=1 Tax=Staphylotrichum tortipilum TaxID=2831512 RepID=A0AAN6MGU7_9PEZI|nr:hypothetical protein C8A05DRAFT_36688 [Staphylotrichum longicolle]